MNKFPKFILFVLFNLFLVCPCVRAVDYTWDGSDGVWSDATHWSPNGTPSNGDTATIGGGTVSSPSIVATNRTLNLTDGTLNVTGTDLTLHTNTTLNQSGGIITFANTNSDGNAWFNVGENAGSVSNYNLTGGSLLNNGGLSYFIVGRRGPGHFTMSGEDTSVVVRNFWLGYAPSKAGGSTATLNGGTFQAGTTYLGGNNADGYTGATDSTYTLTLDGGNFTTGDLYIANNMVNVAGNKLTTNVNINSGSFRVNGLIEIGRNNVSAEGASNTGVMKITGGNVYFGGDIKLGQGDGSVGIMEVSGGTLSFAPEKSFLIGSGGGKGVLNVKDGANFAIDYARLGHQNGTNGEMNVSGGTLTINNELTIGKNGGTGTMNVSGGTVDVKPSTYIGNGTNANGTLHISGGTVTFANERDILVGTNGGTGTMKLSGGTTDVKWILNVGHGANSTGRLEISDNAILKLGSLRDLQIGVNGGTGTVEQTGGTVETPYWINIGENGTGTWNLSGGKIKTTAAFAVGRRGNGTLTISGENTVFESTNVLYVGCFNNLATNCLLDIQGGTVTAQKLRVGNQEDHPLSSDVPVDAVSTMRVSGGNTTFTGDASFGHTGNNAKGGKGVLEVSGGALTFRDSIYFGYKNKGVGVGTISGGTVNFNTASAGNGTVIGFESGSSGDLTITGGTVNTGKLFVGYQGGTGNLTVSGGTVNIGGQPSAIGRGNGSVATFDITGGTVNGPNADIVIGVQNAYTRMTVDGGSFVQPGGNFVISNSNATHDGKTGTLVELKSGKIQVNWFSLGQTGHAFGNDNSEGALSTFDMTGGELKVSGNDFRIGHQGKSIANISGGDISVANSIVLDASGKGSELNIIGAGSTWRANTATMNSTGKLNFIAGALELNEDGTVKPAVSTINITNTATINSPITVDMTNYVPTGTMYLREIPDLTLISAGTLAGTPTIEVLGDWDSFIGGGKIVLSFDKSTLPTVPIASGPVVPSVETGTKGMLLLNGEANAEATVMMYYEGAQPGEGDQLAEWLNEELQSVYEGVRVKNTGNFIEFSKLPLNTEGEGIFVYDITAFNDQMGAGVVFTHLPEPTTWVLMVLGILGLVGVKANRNRASRK